MEEWISLNEFCRRHNKKHDTVKKMIRDGLLIAMRTDGGHFKIKVGASEDTVPRALYEKEKELRIKAEVKLEHIAQLVKLN